MAAGGTEMTLFSASHIASHNASPVDATMALLAAHKLAIGYRQTHHTTTVLDDLTISLRAGELVCLLGPNGAGKSTLMRTLAGLQPALAGELLLGDSPLTQLSSRARAQRIGLVLTNRVSVGHMTAFELVALGRHPHTNWRGTLMPTDEAAVVAALTATGALPLARRAVSELSDGERQKVMIARALAQEPQILLLDEPTAFLDLPRRVELMGMLRDLAHQSQRAILLSTHDLDLALRFADHTWLLPPGGPLYTGTPEDLVLNGILAKAFATTGVQFDPVTGAFHATPALRHRVALHGEGVAAIWTTRALQRAGYALDPDAPLQVRIIETSGKTRWQIGQRETMIACDALCDSIEVLLARLAGMEQGMEH